MKKTKFIVNCEKDLHVYTSLDHCKCGYLYWDEKDKNYKIKPELKNKDENNLH